MWSARRSSAERVARRRIALVCMSCGSRNYKKTKAQESGAAPLALKKFCKNCNQHTEHVEAQ